MPIPQYERQVKAAPVPGVMAPGAGPLSAYGGGEETAKAFSSSGALASDAAGMLWQQAKEAKDEIETARISGAAAELSKLQTKLLHDPETGALNKQGENAFETYQPTMDAFKKGAAEIVGSLTTPEQRAKFQPHVDNAGAQMDQSLNVHISQQRKEYAATNFSGAAEQYANAAEANALTNPQASKQNILLQKGELIKLAQSKGLSPDATRAFLGDQESKTQARIINLMLAKQQDQTAKAYYDSLPAGTLRNEDAVQVAHALEVGSTLGQAQREAARILAPQVVIGDNIVTAEYRNESEALAEARKITDPKVQEMAVHEVKSQFAERKQQAVEDYKGNLAQATDIVERTGDFNQVPVPVKSKLTGTDYRALMTMAAKIKSGEEIQTDWKTFYPLESAAYDPERRDEFLKVDLLKYKSVLGKDEFKLLSKRQAELQKPDAITNVTSFDQAVADTLLKNEIINEEPAKLAGVDLKRVAAFRLNCVKAITDAEIDKKGPLTPAERDAEIEKTLLKSKAELFGVWSNKSIPSGMLLPSEWKDVVVPEEQRMEAITKLKGMNKTVTDEKVKRMWRAALNGNLVEYERIARE